MNGSYCELSETIKAISVRQPFASAIVLGHKQIENRSWATKHRGPLLIHAAGRPYSFQEPTREMRELDRLGLRGRDVDLPSGALVGMVELVDCVPMSEYPVRTLWASGPWCWKLENAVAFDEPIPLRGALSLFQVDVGGVLSSVCDTVRAAIRQMGCATMC